MVCGGLVGSDLVVGVVIVCGWMRWWWVWMFWVHVLVDVGSGGSIEVITTTKIRSFSFLR